MVLCRCMFTVVNLFLTNINAYHPIRGKYHPISLPDGSIVSLISHISCNVLIYKLKRVNEHLKASYFRALHRYTIATSCIMSLISASVGFNMVKNCPKH